MKLRAGFVSNSSSSSFVIKKEDLTEEQINSLLNYEVIVIRLEGKIREFKKELGENIKELGLNPDYILSQIYSNFDDVWGIQDNGDTIFGTTHMDNGDMDVFLKTIGVSEDIVEWEYE